MLSQNKKFDRESYNQNNQKGINTALSIMNDLGFTTLDTKEAYSDRDAIVGSGNVKIKIEAEMSNNWITMNEFPSNWYNISVPYRKHKSGADVYILVNKDLTSVALAYMDDIKKSKVGEKYIRLTDMNEPFFFCDMSIFDIYTKEGNNWIPKKINKNIINRYR
jgi:hypothetical protein